MSDTAVVADLVNPAQAGPATPNAERVPAPVAATEAKTPEQIAAEAEAAKGKTPEELAAEAEAAKTVEAPKLGDEEVEDPNKLEAPTSEDAVDGVITYPATGDPGMDMALEFVGKLGIGMDHPAMQATMNGDFSLIRAHLASLGEKAAGHERMCDLAEQANTRAMERSTAATKARATAVAGVLGEGQAQVLSWASQTATPEEKKSINAMLAADPVQARAAATILLNAYNKAAGTVVEPASAVRDASGEIVQASLTRISRSEFARETNKLHAKHGAGYNQTPEYRALARRLGN